MLRLFTAISVPSQVRNEVAAFQLRLQLHLPSGVIGWAPVEPLHITLNFLGSVPEEEIEPLGKAVTKVCAVFPALQISAKRIGSFPDLKNPRVLWVGAQDKNGQLPVLHALLNEGINSVIPLKAENSFSGHLTIGRFTDGPKAQREEVLKFISSRSEKQFGEWQAQAVEIKRSELVSKGARHAPLLVKGEGAAF